VFAKEDEVSEGGVKVLRANNINKDRSELNLDDVKQVLPKFDFSDEKKLKRDDIFICLASGSKDHIGKVALIKEDTDFYFGGFMGAIRVKPGRLHAGYLLKQLTTGHFNDFLREQIAGANINNLSAGLLYRFQTPLPPLEVQKEIVAEIEGYQKVIDGARAVIDNYRPHIPIHPDWPMVPLDEACDIQRGKFSHRPRNEPRFYGGKYPFIQTGDVVRAKGGKITYTQTLNESGLSLSKLFQPPVVVITIAANIGDTAVLDFPSCFPDSVVGLIPKPGTDVRFLEVVMRTKKQHLNNVAPQAAQKNINIEILKTVEIPLPPLDIQQAIVSEIEAEQTLVNANRELIARFEKKIHTVIARVWGEDENIQQ
jgi:restriction endonuclease S subunit